MGSRSLGSLFIDGRRNIRFSKLEDTIYLLAKAKFVAESAPGVGKQTHGSVLYSDSKRLPLFSGLFEPVRTAWEKTRPESVPVDCHDATMELVKAARAQRKHHAKQQKQEQAREAKKAALTAMKAAKK